MADEAKNPPAAVVLTPKSTENVTKPATWDINVRAAAMQALVVSPGWALLKYLFQTGELRRFRQELENSDHNDLAKVQNLQYKISVIKQLLFFPEAVAEKPTIERLDEVAQMAKGLDPYDTEETLDDNEEN